MSDVMPNSACEQTCEDVADPPKSFSQWAYDLGFTIGQASAPDSMPSGPWSPIGDFLELLGGIDKVDIDIGRFNQSHMMCGRAREYDDLHSDVVTDYGTDLTRFLLTFNVLEETCVAIGLKKHGQHLNHIAKRIETFLESNYVFPHLKHYRCVVDNLLCNGSRTDYRKGLNKLHPAGARLTCGTGVRLAYCVRNRVLHEGFAFPDDPRSSPGADRGVMRASATLALMSVQMMVMCSFELNSIHVGEPYRRSPESARVLLERVHLHREPPDDFDDYEVIG